ncbi:MAG TPA: hypothetical protein VJV75_10950 [Candidatus Polarisedimenticolia bacterium]|nr:hypothetical protein [Candidatus Polarisedimenticolia bacterium]
MPHILLEGRAAITDLQSRHRPFSVREGDRLVKVDRFYADAEGAAALVETLVVEGAHTQRFLVQVTARGDGLSVRLEPMTDPEKTAGVKRALALVAERLREAGGLRYGSTNIPEFLAGARPAGGGD